MQLIDPLLPWTSTSAMTHVIALARGFGTGEEDWMRYDNWMCLTTEPDIYFCAGDNKRSDNCLTLCLLPKRKSNIKKLLLFSERKLWLQLVKSEAKRDSRSYVWCLRDAFWSCQDNGRAYTRRRCIKLLLYLHIDTFTALVDNDAHMVNYILH